MKKIISIILVVIIATMSVFAVSAKERETMIISSDYVIVRGENLSPSEKTATLTLQKYLKQISGIELQIVSDTTRVSDKEIIVGKTNREGKNYTVDRERLGDEGVYIKTFGEKLVIAGGEKRGTLYAVYEFLTKYFDCHWYAKDCIVVPKKSTLEIPKDIDYTFVPVLEYRETDWISPKDTEYSIANHLNGNSYRSLSEENGGTFGYLNFFAHTMSSLIPLSYFAENQEMFALHNGQRTTDQPCLTNPKTLEVAIASCRSILEGNSKGIVCITQNDNYNFCECENCKKIDDENGSHAGTMISFVNAISDALTKDYPEAVFDTFAYQYTRTCPTKVEPNPNVVVRICSIECCFSHPLSDKKCAQNAAFKKDIEDWQKICNHIYIWDYTTNYGNFIGPFPNFGVLQDNMKFFVKNNVKGVYEEGNYMAENSNGEFADLRAYLLSRLMWDPDLNYEQEMINFCNAYYGEAGKYIKKYVDYITSRTGRIAFKWEFPFFVRTHLNIGTDMTDKGTLNIGYFGSLYADNFWEKAKSCHLTDEQKERVLRSEISWRYWKSCNDKCEFSRSFGKKGYITENEKLYNDVVNFGITTLWEPCIWTKNPDFTKHANTWREK